MTRRKLREHLFKLIYLDAFNSEEEMPEQIDLYLDEAEQDALDNPLEENLSEENKEFLRKRWKEVDSKIPEIDRILNSTARGWKTSRFPSCDLAILRLAVFEMEFDDTIPIGVSINEAVELGKEYGGKESPSFINGVLGEIARKSSDEKKNDQNESGGASTEKKSEAGDVTENETEEKHES